MTEFNADNYFNRVAGQQRNQDNSELFQALQNGQGLKERDVNEATQRKVDALRGYRETKEATWTGQLGLDPQSLAGGVVNFGASAVGATAEAGGALVGAPGNLAAIGTELNESDEARQAFNRYQNNEATEADMAFLNQQKEGDAALNAADGYVPGEDEVPSSTILSRLEQAGELRATSEEIRDFTDIRHIIDETARNDFSDEIRSGGAEGIARLQEASQNYEDGETGTAAINLALGLTDLVVNGGSAILNNKQATLEYVAELAPDLLIGAASKPGLVLRNIGMGMEAHNRGIEKYAEENDGALPPEDLQRYMAANAFGAAGLETLAQFSILRSIRGPQVNTGTNTSFSPARVGKATARETLNEGATEAGQAYFEGEASLNPASAMDIYEGATIGAAAGGTATGAGRTVTEVRGRSEEQTQARSNRETIQAEQVAAFEQAAETGDVSQYMDREGDAYDPAAAAAALVRNNQMDPTSEQRTKNNEQMETVLRQAEQDLRDAEVLAEDYTPESVARFGRQIKGQENILQDATKTTEEKAAARENITMLQEKVTRAQEMPADKLKVVQQRVEALRDTFVATQELRNELMAPVTGETTTDVDTLKSDAGIVANAEPGTPVDAPVRAQAASNLVTMSMASPDVLSSVEAQSLASDNANGLSANQRTYLRSFAESMDLQNEVQSLDRTQSAIFRGEDGFRGIREYRSLVDSALNSGDTEGAREYSADLRKFAQGHAQKANALSAAFRQFAKTRQPVQVIRGLNQGEWFISQEKLGRSEMKENQGLTVNAKSKNLIQAVRTEAKSLLAANKEIEALLDVRTESTETTSQQQPEAVSTPESTADNSSRTQETVATESMQREAVTDAETETTVTEQATTETPVEATTTEAADTAVAEPTVEPTLEAEAEPTVTPEPETVLEDGRLEAVTGDHTKGTVPNNQFKTTNLVSAYFTQSAGREGSATVRPLAQVKDFLSQLVRDSSVVQQFVREDGKDLPEREVARATALATFQETVGEWNNSLDELFTTKSNEAFNYTDLAQFLKNEDGTLPENVKTAISYAAWSYVVEKANDSWHNDDDAINAILRQPADTKVSQEQRNLLIDKGTRANVVINSLGERAVKALGLKLHPDAPVNAQAQLESSLGAYAVAVLMEQGLVERPVVKSPLMGESDPSNQRADGEGHPFIRMARNWDSEGKPVNADAKAISDSVKQTQGYLDKVFGVESAMQGPTFEPEGFSQTKTKGTQQNVPGEMNRIQDQQAQKAWKIRTWFNGLWQDIDTDLQDQIMGLEDASTAHISERTGVQGRNDDLQRGKDHLQSFLTDLELNDVDGLNPYDQNFYFNGSVWVNQRVGLTSNTVNPQANKLHRHIMGMADWAGEIPVSATSPKHRLFLANVAMGLGIKADKMPMVKSRKQLRDLVKNPTIRQGLDAVKKQQDGSELTRAEQEQIVNAVNQAGEGMQSLDALHAYARMEMAKEAGAQNFDSDMMMMEVDGVTNGPMLTLLLLGAASGARSLFQNLNRGGFYEVGSPHRNFVAYKDQDGAEDLYETLAKGMNTEMQGLVKAKPALTTVVGAIEYAKGQFFDAQKGKVTSAGRGTVKTPLTGMVFGQAVKSGVNDMFTELTEELYGKITAIARNNDTDAMKADALQEWAGHVNAMMRGKGTVPAQPTLEWALEYQFTKAELQAMQSGFNETIGAAVETTMESQFGVFLDRRKVLNQGAQVSAQLYTMMFEHLKQQKVNELMEAGSLPFRIATGKANKGQKQPLQDLSARQIREIENQLSAMKPVAHSALSSAEGDLKSALFLPKTGKSLSNNANYGQDVGLARPVSANTADGNDIKTFGTKGYESVLEDPGVRSLILMVHSADSAISAYAYDQLSALNVHDANGLSIADVAAGARNLNEATYKVMLAFSVPMELKATMERTVNGLHEMLPMIEASPELQAAYVALESEFAKKLTKEEAKEFKQSGQDWVTFIQQKVNTVAYAAEITKLEALSEMAYVDQYAQEGGEFEVSPELRQEAKAKREKVQLEAATPQNLRQAQQIAKAAKRIDGDAAVTPTNEPGPGVESVETYFNAEEIAAGLKEWVGTKTNEMRQTFLETGTRDARQVTQVRQLKELAQGYAATGSMTTALERVFPGNDQARLRDAWQAAVISKLNQMPFTTVSVLHAPNHAVLPLVDQLLASPDTSTELTASLTAVRDTMLNQQASLALAGDTTLSPQQNAEVVQALGAVYNSSRVTAYGELGTPTTPSDTNMVTFMQNNPNLTAGELMGYLDRRFKENGNQNGSVDVFQRRLLGMLKQTVKADIPVRYVTRDTPETDLPVGSVNGAKGWYEPSLTNEHIGIKSPDFVQSAVTPEVVLHELTHQALGRVVANEQAKAPKDRDTATWELIQDLESMREMAQVKLEDLASAADATPADKVRNLQFKNAVTDVHEFMAWGMTNQAFQKEVLNKLQYETTVKGGNRLITGMQKFIQNLTGLIFGKRADAMQERGLSVLIANVSGLMAAAKESGNQGTTQNQTTQRQETPDPFETVKAYTSEQIFDALGRRQSEGLDPAYSDHLKGVLETIVSKLHGPAGAYKVTAQENAAFGSEDVFLNSLMGRMPFASEIMGQPFKITQQEAFVLEQVEATIQASADSSTAAYRELAKLYRETKSRLKPEDFFDGDWSQATPDEIRQAEAQYNFIFQPQANADGSSNYLSRFAAMGLAYAPLKNKMDAATVVEADSIRGMPLGEKLKTIFARLVNLLNGRLTKTFQGQRADQKLATLMDQLVSIESRRRTALAQRQDKGESALEGSLNKLNDNMRKKADDFGKSKFFRESKSGVVQAVGVATSAVAGDRVRQVFDNIEHVRNRNFKDRQGFLAAIATELKGANETNLTAHKLLRMANKNQRERQNVIEQNTKAVMESYADKGEYLTDADTQAITRVVLRTDMAALMDTYTADDLLNLVRDPKALKQAIKNTEAQVQGKARHYYVRGAKDMGYFMATNINRNDNLMLNAYNLSRLVGTGREKTVTAAEAKAVEGSLDQLASLYALQYSPSKDRGLMAEVMKTELQRGNESGVEMTLKLHKQMKQQSMESLFENQPSQFMKGYTREIYNQYKNIVIAGGVEGLNLERAGARKGPLLEIDKADLDQEQRRIYTIEDGGNRSRVTGIFSNTGTRRRGTAIHNGNPRQMNQNTNALINRRKAAAINSMFDADPTYDPQKKAPQKMVPVVNNGGQVVNHRYMMTAETKDTLLERNNRVGEVMGSMAGNIVDKVSTQAYNETAVNALREQYRMEGPTNPNAFIEVSMNSTDPEIRETYRLLPDNTKKHIKQVWGRDAMMVRVDLFDIHFGYRKRSVTQTFEKDADERNVVENVVVNILESDFLLGKKAALRVRQAEDVWQALVKEIKDLLVIKRLPTLMLNISSNVTALVWMGVSPKDIVKNHRIALDGALNYQRDSNELMRLQQMKDIGYITQPVAEMEARIVELTDAINRNPVKKMIDGGMFQTIIDDVDNSADDYNYKSKLMRKLDDSTKWLPQRVKDTSKFFYMAHDTPLYKLMHQGASLSDFIARYTLYEHMTNRQKKPMDSEAAMQLAVDAFVNYDIPTHRFMQYLNDMGIVYFTKYYLRIQKVLLNLYKDSPGRALGLSVFGNYFNETATLMDSGFWNRLEDPTSNGAFGYPGAIGEAVPIKSAMSLFQ